MASFFSDGEVQLPQGAAAEAEELQIGVFGPLEAQPPAKMEEIEDAQPEDVEVSRKRPQEHSMPNGSPTKRARLSNGYDHATDAASVATPMEVDHPHEHLSEEQHLLHNDDGHSQDNHAYPSPLEGEQVSPSIVRTDGPEQGTQVDKVEELSPDTTFIRLVDDARATETTPSPSPAGAENAPILLQCEWNPRDPSILAAAGTDALARVWTVSRTTAPEPGQDHVSPHARPLIDPDTPRSTTVTALAWTSDGTAIAVATDSGSQATVNVWSVDGVHLQGMEVSEPPVIKLNWNPSNTCLLAISPDKGGALVTVYLSSSGNSLSYHLNGHDIVATPLDATWINDGDFLLSGGDLLVCLRCGDTSIEQLKKFETKEDDSFTQVLYDERSKLAATSSDKGTLDVSNAPCTTIQLFFYTCKYQS